ncbi:MAG: flagellar basal-body rod protein FlgG [Planctomycetes bacterium]|nr:flagellar basal-body rod protein FlgG [Planctomycetota bacterium]
MMKGLFTAASGMKVQQVNVDVIANNLANVNTAGYKRTQADFQDLLYVVMKEPGAQTQSGFTTPSGVQIGSGAELVSTTKVYTPGVLEQTERALDVAILGDGFFEVDLPNGQKGYTRDGGLRVDGIGQLVTAQGFRISPPIVIDAAADKNITIAQDGTVTVRDSITGANSTLGTLQLARFANPAGLRSGGGNLVYETASSGTPTLAQPGQSGTGTLAQNTLERSNVNVVNELVSLITAQRAYEMNSRAIKAGDEMLSEASNLVR